jgi:zinc transport system ATP-binding protein
MSESNILVKLSKAGIFRDNKWLVKEVSLEIRRGKIVTLIGPNGSGKSTTAKIVLGIHKNIEGSVERFTKNVSYVPQKISIDWTLPLRVSDFMVLTQNLSSDEINEALILTGVKHLKDRNLRDLSGGEFQRVLLARAIGKKPELLVLDEPVQGCVVCIDKKNI